MGGYPVGDDLEDHGNDGHPQEAVLNRARIVDVVGGHAWSDHASVSLRSAAVAVSQTLHIKTALSTPFIRGNMLSAYRACCPAWQWQKEGTPRTHQITYLGVLKNVTQAKGVAAELWDSICATLTWKSEQRGSSPP